MVDFLVCVEVVLKLFGNWIVSIDYFDGVIVDLGDDSWFNLCSLNIELLLWFNVEGCSVGDVDVVVC